MNALQQKDGSHEEFVSSYNARDLILYALSVGFGSDAKKKNELRYLYEDHRDFVAFPTFCLALSFWADQTERGGTSYKIPLYPALALKSTGTIPVANLRPDAISGSSEYPILHMWQSIVWHQKLPVPGKFDNTNQVKTRLKCKTLSIVPKSIGTFVTGETQICQEPSGSCIATLQSTTLVLGIPKQSVIPMGEPSKSKVIRIPMDQKPLFEWSYTTLPTQALLYRLASGDSNPIHVIGDDKMNKALGLRRPILHGLCTFGIAARAILGFVKDTAATLSQMEGRFTKPVLIGDTLTVRIWERIGSDNERTNNKNQRHYRTFAYIVLDQTTGEVAINNGLATIYTEADAFQNKAKL